MGKCNQELLAERARNIPLYLHAYAFHLNMRYERVLPGDLLDIAHQQQLKGVKIHVEDGESQSLQKLNDRQLHDFTDKAKKYNLERIGQGDIDGCDPYCCGNWRNFSTFLPAL